MKNEIGFEKYENIAKESFTLNAHKYAVNSWYLAHNK